MTSRLLISLSLLLTWQKVCAQLAPADVFFNSGAQLYISNNIPAALESTEAGLKQYPSDEKLKKLEALLKQQQQQQSQQNQQQNQQNQSQQQKSNGQQNQQQQKQQSSANNSQDQKKVGQQKQQQASAQKKEGDKQDQQNAEGQLVHPRQMTPEEAKRLLDAQKGNEQVLQLKPQGKPEDQNRPIKDW
jgi:Ca-activated chloride channel family protein